jgi:hypothetical protein
MEPNRYPFSLATSKVSSKYDGCTEFDSVPFCGIVQAFAQGWLDRQRTRIFPQANICRRKREDRLTSLGNSGTFPMPAT